MYAFHGREHHAHFNSRPVDYFWLQLFKNHPGSRCARLYACSLAQQAGWKMALLRGKGICVLFLSLRRRCRRPGIKRNIRQQRNANFASLPSPSPLPPVRPPEPEAAAFRASFLSKDSGYWLLATAL